MLETSVLTIMNVLFLLLAIVLALVSIVLLILLFHATTWIKNKRRALAKKFLFISLAWGALSVISISVAGFLGIGGLYVIAVLASVVLHILIYTSSVSAIEEKKNFKRNTQAYLILIATSIIIMFVLCAINLFGLLMLGSYFFLGL